MEVSQSDPQAAWSRFESDIKAFVNKVGVAARDAEVRAGASQAARSFGVAVGETVRRIGDDLARSFRDRS